MTQRLYEIYTHTACSCFIAHSNLLHIQINVVAFSARYDIPIGAGNLPEGASWVEPSTRDELKKVYEGWGPDVSILLDCMPEKPSKWSIHVLYPPLESYTKGRVALLGDAVRHPSSASRLLGNGLILYVLQAHGMLPHMGAGAGQGLEDAFMLSRLLSHPDTNAENIEVRLWC